jgi:hypothetical protein
MSGVSSAQAPPVEAVVSVESVSKSYPGVLALDGVSFDLRAGEFMHWSARTAPGSPR